MAILGCVVYSLKPVPTKNLVWIDLIDLPRLGHVAFVGTNQHSIPLLSTLADLFLIRVRLHSQQKQWV